MWATPTLPYFSGAQSTLGMGEKTPIEGMVGAASQFCHWQAVYLGEDLSPSEPQFPYLVATCTRAGVLWVP